MKHAPDTYPVAALLSVTGGFLDAYTFLSRDGVFANAQTGNFARLAMSVAGGDLWLVVRFLIPILSFIVGISVTMWISRHAPVSGRLHWQHHAILLEILLLASVSVIPDGQISNIAANVLVSFTCAVQVESFRKVLGNSFASTMCTGNLRIATENLNNFFLKKEKPFLQKSLQYFGIDVLFVLGAFIGTFATGWWGVHATVCCCLMLSAVFIMMIQKPQKA